MKKIFFSLSAVLFAAASFAQGIVLEHTFVGYALPSSSFGATQLNPIDFDECFLYWKYDNNANAGRLAWVDETYTEHILPNVDFQDKNLGEVIAASHLFTTDNRMSFLIPNKSRNNNASDGQSQVSSTTYEIYDEFGTLIHSFGPFDYDPFCTVVYIFGEYKLFILGWNHEQNTYVYSLPGQGKTATGNETIQSAPRRGRKYVQDAQVLVEENNRTYNTTGARVK